jgi:hypothetical protein
MQQKIARLPVSPDAEPQKYGSLTTHLGVSNLALSRWVDQRRYSAQDMAEIEEIQRQLDLKKDS